MRDTTATGFMNVAVSFPSKESRSTSRGTAEIRVILGRKLTAIVIFRMQFVAWQENSIKSSFGNKSKTMTHFCMYLGCTR